MVENKTVLVSLDKLDQEQINALKERTGKSEVEILKLALNELHRKLVENQPDQKQAPVIFVNPPIIVPLQPIQPTTVPLWPNWEPTWLNPSWTTCSENTGTTTIHMGPIVGPCNIDNIKF